MVNYCCVAGCGRNSRSHGYLTFYTIPRDKTRQTAWLKAACPELLGLEDRLLRSRRFCSRHFAPSAIRHQRLLPDAMPTLCLTGGQSDDEEIECPQKHGGLECDGCSGPIVGFRYTCTECKDYDLCQRCETNETHGSHRMLRLPKPVDFETAKSLMQKWSTVKKEETNGGDSSDDEPITKYREQKDDDEWSLSEYDKERIRQEIARAITASKQMKVSKETLEKKKLKKNPRKQSVKSSKANTSKFSQIDVVTEKETENSEDELATEFVGVETDSREILAKVKRPVGAVDNPISTGRAGAAVNRRDVQEKEVISISDDELSVQYASLDNCAEYASHRPKVPAETAFALRQPVMDIGMNDTLSEFLIKKI